MGEQELPFDWEEKILLEETSSPNYWSYVLILLHYLLLTNFGWVSGGWNI